MRVSNYIVIKKNGWRYSTRLTAKAPALAHNEIAIKLAIDVPDEIFTKPALEATVKIPKEAVRSNVIEAAVIDNVQEIIKQNLGFDVKLQIVDSNED